VRAGPEYLSQLEMIRGDEPQLALLEGGVTVGRVRRRETAG